jgi:hypothetical protein
MYVTEKEALRMWCPDARVAHFSSAEEAFGDADTAIELATTLAQPCNRLVVCLDDDSDPRDACRAPAVCCIGSQCMAWRWSPTAAKLMEDGIQPTGYCGKVRA